MTKPAFQVSLTKDQTLELGRFCAVWGQIDHFLMHCITRLVAVDLAAGVMITQDMTTGQLVNLFRKNRKRIRHEDIRKIAKEFCDEMGSLIEFRNHIMHGIWGFYLPGKNPRKGKPACLFVKNPDNPKFPDELPEAANRAALLSRKIYVIYCYLYDQELPVGDDSPKFWFGQHVPRPPKGTQLVPIGLSGPDRPSSK